jgi:hypothetical protein
MATISSAVALGALKYAGPVKVSTRQKGTEVLMYLAGKGFSLTHVWGYDANAGNPEHHSGYALDFMVFRDKAVGDMIFNYLWANRVRLGVKHIIWYQSIISTVVSPGVRRTMADRGNTTANHMDHVHVLFNPTAYTAPVINVPPPKPPSPGQPTPPPKVTPVDLVVDGRLGPKTYSAINRLTGRGNTTAWDKPARVKLQQWLKVPADGVIGRTTIIALQKKLGVKQDGDWGPATTTAFQKYLNAR